VPLPASVPPTAVPWPRGASGLCYGGDYNPEQWPESVWAEDVALMRQAGVNLVSLGVFSWSRLEPAEGKYEFDWLDRVMDLLADNGVGVALATPTASPPPWFGMAYPDALPVRPSGTKVWHGSRDTYCVSAPAYREASVRMARALGERYADHPALAMWHIHNEYGTPCMCDHVAEAFRGWLRARHGDLDRLNAAWTTSFWSQHYSDWSQILPPRETQYLANPSQVLDFRRFVSDELLGNYCAQRDALREVTPDVPATTNFVMAGWVSVNPRAWAAEMDLVAIDHYPSSLGATAHETAFAADLARSWADGQPWLLIEQATSLVYERRRIATRRPGEMTRISLSHVARGSRGVMFFQWRQPLGGAEMFHSAMVPHAGPDTRLFREVTSLGSLLGELAEVDAGSIEAEAAILWDTESWWALQVDGLPSKAIDYADEVRTAHRTLWRAGVPVDFADPLADLSTYRLVVVPALYLLCDAAAASIASYVERGGHLVVSYLSGIADPEHRVRLGGYPGAFREVLGIRVEELHPLDEGERIALSTGGSGSRWAEHVHATDDVEVLVRYAGDGPLAGLPAVTAHRYGLGTAWYVSTRLEDAAYERVLLDALGEPSSQLAPEGVEVVRRRASDNSWCFILNHSDEEHQMPARGVDLVTGRQVDGEIRVPAGGFAVVREERQ
jgi:beta-galactosidase